MNRWFPLFIVLSSVCLAAPAGEIETIRFGVCLSTSGEFQAAGKKAVAGIKLRLEEFNSRSQETGLRLEMVLRDDESKLERALEVLEELAVKEKVPAIIGPLSTSLMLGMEDKAREHEVVLLSPTVTSPRIGKDGDWSFRLLFDDQFQGVALARYAGNTLGVRRAGVIINNRLPYSESVYLSFKKTLEELGGEVVCEERYEWVADEEKPYDFSAILQCVADAKPEIVLLPVNSTEVAAIVRSSLEFDLDTVFCGGDTWQHESVLLSSGNNLEDAFYIAGIDFESDNPAMRHYLDLFNHSNDPDAQLTSVLGFDALSLLIKAMENGSDSKAIRDGLYAVKDFDLAIGTITIDKKRGSEKTAFINRIIREDGEFVPVVVDEIKP